MNRYILLFVMATALGSNGLRAQSSFTASLQSNFNVFLKDERIGAANTPQYEDEIFGMEHWLELQYRIKKFTFAARLDGFLHSNLLNPTDSYSDWGLGRFNIAYREKKWMAEIGYIYDQIGAGLIFRAYEERPLFIDNALIGGHVEFQLPLNFVFNAYGGRQRNLFSIYDSDLIGGSLETNFQAGGMSWFLGGGLVQRQWAEEQIDPLIRTVQIYEPQDRVELFEDTYAFTFYHTLNWGVFSWNSEWAFQNYGVFFDPFVTRSAGATEVVGAFQQRDGSVFFNAISLAFKEFSLAFEWKRTEDFDFRADPFATLNRGLVNFIPPMSRVNSFRLKTRYIPATQFLGEQAFQLDLTLKLSKKWRYNQYYSFIEDLDGNTLYTEVDNEFFYRNKSALQIKFGVQWQTYNQGVFEGKGAVPLVKTFVPYVEYLKRIARKKTIRIEAQYLSSEQDFGSWIFALAEYSIAPRWSFALSDMYNVEPTKGDDIHYPRLDVFYNRGSSRYSLSFIKQVEGVVCAGGICRLEPAFSGVRASVITNF